MSLFSTPSQLEQMHLILANYMRLPTAQMNIPGYLMESILAHVRGATVLNTYDFVDVVDAQEGLGWQVKSTRASTPVTWKRAKIPNASNLIEASHESEEGLQMLGDSIIGFCNDHARSSLETYELDEIGYSRVVLQKNGYATYFERLLCSHDRPNIFDPSEFTWKWSTPKKTQKKEQLPALHGINRSSGKKWWAWHGLGENQLHFSGESAWWPGKGYLHSFGFQLPLNEDRLSFEQLNDLLSS